MTLKELAVSDERVARGAAALLEAGYADGTLVAGLTPGSVTRTLVEALARELARLYEQLGEVYDSAFVETATGDSLEVLVDQLCPAAVLLATSLRPRVVKLSDVAPRGEFRGRRDFGQGKRRGEGFEPSSDETARNGFRDRRIRPLCHPSRAVNGEGGIRTLEGGILPLNALAGRRLQPLGHFSAGCHSVAQPTAGGSPSGA